MASLGPVTPPNSGQQRLDVALGDRSYPIFIGRDLLEDQDRYRPYLTGSRVMVVSNETVAPLYLEAVRTGLAGFETAEVILPDGEEYKDLATLNRIAALLTLLLAALGYGRIEAGVDAADTPPE